MKRILKLSALLLVLTLWMDLLASCAGPAQSEVPLVVGYRSFTQKFSPFFAEVSYDSDVAAMTQTSLLTKDRTGGIVYNAIEGETIPYNGTPYTYQGIADLSVSYDEATDITTYTAKIRDDIHFSDGTVMDADDIIFTYYVLLDTSYDGISTLSSVDIVGLTNYRYNNSHAEHVTDATVAEALTEPSESVQAVLRDMVVTPLLTDELAWAEENYAQYGAESGPLFFVQCYNTDTSYSAAGKTGQEVLADMIAQYGADYVLLATMYAGDSTYLNAEAHACVENFLITEALASGEGETVSSISGIRRVSDTEVEVRVNGYDASALYAVFDISVAPMHYYGDEKLYDEENGSFGFPRGDLSLVKSKTTVPMGAGPYRFLRYENGVVYFEANEQYYKGPPATKYVQFKETPDADLIAGVAGGTIDIATPTGSKAAFDQIRSHNDGALSGNTIVTSRVNYLGYGYMAINADTVCVGGDPASEASKNFRKGFATILAAYRNLSIASYFGDAAEVIEYPISSTSWAAPQKTDDGYQEAFSTDVNGNPIYTAAMDESERAAAALQAAVEFFKAAGCTYDEASGTFIAVPDGAKLEYEFIVPGDGSGNHATFSAVANASEALRTIGFTLLVNDPVDANMLWDKVDAGTHEMWSAGWLATVDPDLYQVYHSANVLGAGGTNSNSYGIQDSALDSLIISARQSNDQAYRKTAYKACFDIIMDWAVEIPSYQRQDCTIFNPAAIDQTTIPTDITTYWNWMNEIEKIATTKK